MINLVKFNHYLSRKPTGNDSPVSIKAKDLDGNFDAVTLVDSSRGIYSADYTIRGTEIVFRDHDLQASWQKILVTDTNGLTKLISVLGTDGTDDAIDPASFQIVIRSNSGAGYVWGIGALSAIFSDFQGSNRISITGTIDGASGWYAISANDEMWLELTFDQSNGSVSSVSVKTKGNGNSYSTGAGKFSKIIGRNLGTSTVPRIHQIMPIGAQRVSNECVNGTSSAILVAF
jgi:hypothetical protein